MKKTVFTGAATALITPFRNREIDYEAFEVEAGAKVILADYATLKLNEGVEAYIDGIFNANDHSKLQGTVKVYGAGEFWVSTKVANNTWELANPGWTGEDWGW